MEIFVGKYSDKGGRNNNEDCVGVLKNTFVVADGLGGHQCGEVASQMVVDYILKKAECLEDIENATMHVLIQELNTVICMAKNKDNSLGNMASTVVAGFVFGEKFNYLNVGDSRMYYFRNKDIMIQSKDHSVTQACVDMGMIEKEDIRFHEDRNKLTKVIGLSSKLKILNVFEPIEMQKDDAVLLCTDGFWEYINENEMVDLLITSQTPQKWIEKMLKVIKKRTQKDSDNLSVVAVFVK